MASHILQSIVENIIKQKVFLDSNVAVSRLGKDMVKLRNLLSATHRVIEDVKTTRLPDSRAKLLRSNTMQPVKVSEFVQRKGQLRDRLVDVAIHASGSDTGLCK